MANLAGTNLAAPVVPFTTDDIYATHEALYGKGGWRSVLNYSDLASIKDLRKETGMAVYVIADKKTYILLADGTWADLFSNLNSFEIEVVDSLPVEGIKDHTIYFLPANEEKENNIYNEFIYVNNSWELVGSTAIDLTGYATEEWVENKGYLTEHLDLSSYATKDDIPDVSDFITENDLPQEYVESEEIIGEVEGEDLNFLKIKYIKDHSTGVKFYPVTHVNAVAGLDEIILDCGTSTKNI